MNRTKCGLFCLTLLCGAGLAPAMRADVLSVELVQSTLTGTPGATVAFFATIFNLSATDTIFLNGDSSITSTPFLTVNDAPFNANAPFSLDPSADSGPDPFEFFDITIDSSAVPGTYVGNLFSIVGGTDAGTFDDLVDVPFSVTVDAPSVSTPEPATLWLFLTVLIALGVVRWTRYNRTNGLLERYIGQRRSRPSNSILRG